MNNLTKRKQEVCFCGKKAIGNIGIPVIQLTESGKAVNVEKGQSSMIISLCPYHSVFVEKGILKTDGKQILKIEPLLEFEAHTNECLIKQLKEGKRKKGIVWKRFLIMTILEARHREKVYPEFLEKIKEKIDILEMMKIAKNMFKLPDYSKN